MELNDDFIAIQGIFLNLEKNLGELKTIKHKGGNEEKIATIVEELNHFLQHKNYIKDNHVNNILNNELRNIVLFLILNTDIDTELDEHSHLAHIMPLLSKLVFASLITELRLTEILCQVLEKLSLTVINNLLSEIALILRNYKMKVYLKDASLYLKLIIKQVSAYTKKEEEHIEQLSDLSSILLLRFKYVQPEEVQGIKKSDKIYKSLGYAILKILDLLLECDKNNDPLKIIIENLMETCASLMQAVTLDVFCSWAEFQHDGKVFQLLIAEKAYIFIEKYQKYEPAKMLISMLGTIAKKPKTLNELIQEADISTIISMVDEADQNQKRWFKALLNTKLLKNSDALKCVGKWAHLCTSEDVSFLLNLSASSKDPVAKKVAAQCASALDYNELILITTRYFHTNGVDNNLSDNIQQQLTLLFNKIEGKTELDEDFGKELQLLVLQNPKIVLSFIFNESLKNSFYSCILKNILPAFKEIAHVNNIGVEMLNQGIRNNQPNDKNFKNYTELFNTLVQINFYTINEIVMEIIMPLLENAFKEQNYQLTKYWLEILNGLQENVRLKEETDDIFKILFSLMKTCRCKFLEFDIIKQDIVKECVDIVNQYCENDLSYAPSITNSDENKFTSFYINKLLKTEPSTTLLHHLCPEIDLGNSSQIVTNLIKVLPLCVIQEWKTLILDLFELCGCDKTGEYICDFAILLCHLVNSQKSKTEELDRMQYALKYCLQQVGIVIKEVLQRRIQSLMEDVNLSYNVCRLLKDIPNDIKSENGIPLASLLSERSLRHMKKTKKFVCLIASINDPQICQLLSQKMLS